MNKDQIYSVSDFDDPASRRLVALVNQGFGAMEGPSPMVLENITVEAQIAATRYSFKKRHTLLQRIAAIAAVAAAMVLVSNTFFFTTSTNGKFKTGNEVFAGESNADVAALLLDIQGLGEDDFFMTEEVEALWL